MHGGDVEQFFHSISEKMKSLSLKFCIQDFWAVSSSHGFILKTFYIVFSCFFSLLINQLVSKLNNLTILSLKMHFKKILCLVYLQENLGSAACAPGSALCSSGTGCNDFMGKGKFQVSVFCSAPFTGLHTSGGAEGRIFQQQFASFPLVTEIADALDLGWCSDTAEPSAQPHGFKGVCGFNLEHLLSWNEMQTRILLDFVNSTIAL